MNTRIYYGWVVLATCFCIHFLAMGTGYYGLSVVLKPMIEAMGWNRAEGTATITVVVLVMGLGGPLIAYLIHQVDIRLTLLVGCLSIAVGSNIAFLAESLLQLYVGVAFIGFGVAAQNFICTGQLINRWFRRQRSLAFGILLAGTGVGAFVMTPTFSLVIEATGEWRLIFLLMGLTTLITAILATLLVRNYPEQMGTGIDGLPVSAAEDESTAPTSELRVYQSNRDWEVAEAFRTVPLWIIVMTTGTGLLGVNLVSSQAILHLTDQGISSVLAGTAVGLVGFASIFGRLGGGFLGDRFEPRYLAVTGLLCLALAFTALIFADQPWLVYSFAGTFGVGFGLIIVTTPLMLSNFFGGGSFAQLTAVSGVITVGFSAFGPVMAGYANDRLGSYTLVFGGFIGLVLLLSVWVAMLRPPNSA